MTTETLTIDDLERERDELINVMQGMVDEAPEPGTFRVKDVLHAGDEEYPAPIIAKALSSAGYVYIYDTLTGERSITNRNMLPTQLQKMHPNKTKVFTTIKPSIGPIRGTHTCMLHPEYSERKRYDSWGLPTCRKSNLTSDFQVRMHMERRHKIELKTIEEERGKQEKVNEKMQQEALLEAMLKRRG